MPKTIERKKHKAFLVIVCIAVAVFLFLGNYPHKTYDPNPTQILALKLAEARNVEIENIRKLFSDAYMRISALEKRKPRTIIKYVPQKKGKG